MGRRVRCPDCAQAFVAGPPPSSMAENAASWPTLAAPSPATASAVPIEDRSGWPEVAGVPVIIADPARGQGVRSGLLLQMLAHLLYIAGLAILFFMALIFLLARDRPFGNGIAMVLVTVIFLKVSILALLVNQVLSIVAASYWLSAPLRENGRPMAIATLILSVVALVRMGDSVSLVLLGPWAGRAGEMGLLGGLLLIVAMDVARLTLLALFAAALAKMHGNAILQQRGRLLAIATPAAVGTTLLVFFLGLVAFPQSREVFLPLLLLWGATYIVAIILNIFMLFQLRRFLGLPSY
jgi:hypothetical protein